MSNWTVILFEPARLLLLQLAKFLGNVFLVIVILILGWLISSLLKTMVTKTLKTLKLDKLAEYIELNSLFKKGGIGYSFSELMGVICYWLLLLVTFMLAANAVGLTATSDLLNRVVLYIPNVIAAIFVLVLGMFIASFLKNIIRTAASNAGLSQGMALGAIVEVIVFIFAVLIVLEQLNVGLRIAALMLGIVLGAIGLGVGLAFGLGCKDIAGTFVSDFIDKIKSSK